jgi:hypothetical protein
MPGGLGSRGIEWGNVELIMNRGIEKKLPRGGVEMKRFLKVMPVMTMMMLFACVRVGAQGTPVEGTVEATGKLVKVMAVGGESAGWVIEFEKEISFGGNGVHSIEVEGDAKKFGKLENKKVTVKGNIVHRSGTERKDRMVIVVQKIKEWKAPVADRPSSY